MEYFAVGSKGRVVEADEAGRLVDSMLAVMAPIKRALIIPPDFSRRHSWAGVVTGLLFERLKSSAHVEIMPALGTHRPMTDDEIADFFPGIPRSTFVDHDHENDVDYLGEVPADYVAELSEGRFKLPIPVGVNKKLTQEPWDRIFSVGQLVPHEVIGVANYNKNIFVGVGGAKSIHRTHILSAVIGLENLMGKAHNPVRAVLNYASDHFARSLPITYLLTVRDRDSAGSIVTRGFYAGDGHGTFSKGAELAESLNINVVERPPRKVVAFMDGDEYHTTWLANKAVYRTRMAVADQGELIVLAPGVKRFGENPAQDRLIRRHGYVGADRVLERIERDPELAENLSVAAHLIHASSEGRFRITYAAGSLADDEIRSVNYQPGDLAELTERYRPDERADGWNRTDDGEEFYYVSKPGLGLWMSADRKQRRG